MNLRQIEKRLDKLIPQPLTVVVEVDGEQVEMTTDEYLSGPNGVMYKQVRGADLHNLGRILWKLAPDIINPKAGEATC